MTHEPEPHATPQEPVAVEPETAAGAHDGNASPAAAPLSATDQVALAETPQVRWTQWIRQGLRAAAWRPLRTLPQGPNALQMALLVGLAAIANSYAARLQINGAAEFSARSWLLGWATTGLLVSGIWLLVNIRPRPLRHESPVAAWFLLSSVAALPMALCGMVLSIAMRGEFQEWWVAHAWHAWGIYIAVWIWFAGASLRIGQAVSGSRWLASGMALWALSVGGLSASTLQVNAWHAAYDPDDSDDAATLTLSQEVFEAQQALFNNTLQAIEPHGHLHGNSPRQFYGLIYAPYSQAVFVRESAMVQELLEQRFDAQHHVIRLLNHPSTTATVPWATNQNLQRALHALANAMDIERDVLVLYLTSHGGADFTLATQHWPLDVPELTASQLRDVLDQTGIRNRVIAVSACYAGGWIEPLASDSSLVMTAADKDHTSYGCGSKSTLTFFGRAVFDEQLRKTLSFEQAFNAAVPIIAQREKDAKKSDGFSNPQLSVGKDIRAVLREWERQHAPTQSMP
jgi:hypothetical protein